MTGDAAANPDVEVIEGHGADGHDGLSGGGFWIRDVGDLEAVETSMLSNEDGFHGGHCTFEVRGTRYEPWTWGMGGQDHKLDDAKRLAPVPRTSSGTSIASGVQPWVVVSPLCWES